VCGRCPCLIDGVGGLLCEIATEQVCINQCSGHGECRLGFCLCYEGYYGHDCARLRAGFNSTPGQCSCRDQSTNFLAKSVTGGAGDEVNKPWLLEAMVPPPAAADSPTFRLKVSHSVQRMK
jgi:hypothetical protein